MSKSLYLTTGRETTPSSGKRCLEEVLAPPPLFGDFEGLLRAESRAKNRSSNSSRSSNRSRSSSQRKQSTAHSIDCGVPNWLLYRARAPEDLSALDCASRKTPSTAGQDEADPHLFKRRPWLVPKPNSRGRYAALPPSVYEKAHCAIRVETQCRCRAPAGSLPLESKDIEKARNRYNSLRSTLEETRLGGATTSQAMRIALKQHDYTQFLNVVNQELIVLDKGMGEALKLTTRRDKRLRQFLGDIAERQGAVVNELFDVATSILAVTDKRVPHRMLIDGRLHSRARSREQNRLASTLQDRHKHTIEHFRPSQKLAKAPFEQAITDVARCNDILKESANHRGTATDISSVLRNIWTIQQTKDIDLSHVRERIVALEAELVEGEERLQRQMSMASAQLDSMSDVITKLKSQITISKDEREQIVNDAYEAAYSRAKGQYVEEIKRCKSDALRWKEAVRTIERDLEQRAPKTVCMASQTNPVVIGGAASSKSRECSEEKETKKAPEKKLSAWEKFKLNKGSGRPSKRPGKLTGIVNDAVGKSAKTETAGAMVDPADAKWAERCLGEVYAFACTKASALGNTFLAKNTSQYTSQFYFLGGEIIAPFSSLVRCYF